MIAKRRRHRTAVDSAAAAEARQQRRETILFWILAAFLLLLALTGGSSRNDVLPLTIHRPVAIGLCALGGWTIGREQMLHFRLAFLLLGGAMLLTLLHLLPLPPAIWQALPGRALLADIDARAGLGAVWRPISMTPPETRNALYGLSVPLAVLLLGAQLGRRALERLVLVLLGIALLGGMIALLQIVGPPGGPFYFYRQTSYGDGTGLFANRNHQAIFLATAFPMLAALISSRMGKPDAVRSTMGAIALGVIIVPLVLITGSRAGMVIAMLGLAATPLLLRMDLRQRRSSNPLVRRLTSPRMLVLGGVAGLAALVALTVGMSRAMSVTRILEVGADAELRFKVWPVIFAAIPTYLPIGSGVGSFVQIFQITEPDAILRPTYLNHAHNELLEVALTAGVPGALLLLVAIGGWAVAAWHALRGRLRRDLLFARLGLVVIGLLALGSVADYPLRTPFLAAFLAVATLWTSLTNAQSSK